MVIEKGSLLDLFLLPGISQLLLNAGCHLAFIFSLNILKLIFNFCERVSDFASCLELSVILYGLSFIWFT